MTSTITYFDLTTSSSPSHPQLIEMEDEEEQICGDGETYTLARFLFIFLSIWIAFLGIVGNLVLFYVFIKHKYPNTPPTLYPSALAILDSIICLMYILLFGADAMVNFWQWHSLFLIYHIYIVPAFVISRITQLAIPYMLIFATLERLVWIVGDLRNKILKKMYSHQGRKITMILSLSICVILRLPTYFAVEVYEYPKCDDFFRSKTASASPWVPESLVYHIYDFHLLSIAQTVFPFIVLITFNFIIVRRLYVIKYNDREEITVSEIPLKTNSIDYGNQTEHRPSIFPPDKETESKDTSLLYSKTLMLSGKLFLLENLL
uniref:G-protein coupled receptors family 1 profile domain-containing protein n=1 Tax=Panagrolaimus davidi TaxID=227884 RepID=A0A914PX80_9BILA